MELQIEYSLIYIALQIFNIDILRMTSTFLKLYVYFTTLISFI